VSDDLYTRFTEAARKSLELSLREALSLGHNYVGTEHLLLGLMRQEDTLARKVLDGLGVTPDAVRQETIRQLSRPHRVKSSETLTVSELLQLLADAWEAKA
jgi:ATP-dependent Clp protease ATP-binding subunit ClpA